MKKIFPSLFLVYATSSAFCQSLPLMNVLKKELNREIASFKKTDQPPYYIDYRVTDTKQLNIEASFGSLTQSAANHSRMLSTHVKVGSYGLDNTHPTDKKGRFDFDSHGGEFLPLDNDTLVIAYMVWKSTQNKYRMALEEFKEVKSQDPSAEPKIKYDFSKEPSSQYIDTTVNTFEKEINKVFWEDRLRELSKSFLSVQDIVTGETNFHSESNFKYFISSEGSTIVQHSSYVYLFISAKIRAADGDIVPLHKSYYAQNPDELPSLEVMLKDISAMCGLLIKLKNAPVAEPYTGPAILSAPVAGVFFHEIFGHRVEGHRLRDEKDGQTFKEKLNEQVLAKTMNVTFDPTRKVYQGHPLNGYYLYDDEGVQGRPVKVVEKGILKTFLMSRKPLESIAHSNGHGRGSNGAEAVSRQSNLIVETTKSFHDEELRKLLIKECVKQGKQFGYLFNDVQGGFTNTGRYSPNAFNIFPTEVYRIFVNGQSDELVRGVDLIGTPLAMFSEIVAAGDQKGVFSGFCGAESGFVPVSAVSPALFVRRIETQKKPKFDHENTLLPPPSR